MDQSATYMANHQDAETGRAVYTQINQEFNRGPEINRDLLMRILKDNKDTEYGTRYGFSDIRTVEEYQKRVPVIVYDHIAEAIERMCNGEQNVLTAYPFSHMNETSATMGNVDTGRLKRPVAHWLQPQTARLYRDIMVFKGASANQLKPVRIIMNEKQRKFFFGLLMG